MKYTYLVAAVVLMGLAACENKPSGSEKAQMLEELRLQQIQIGAQIKELEEELMETGEIPPSGRKVVATAVQPGPFQTYVEVQGRVDARENVDVSAETMGVVRAVNVREGDRVAKGAVLAELDNVLIKQGISELEPQLEFAKQLFEKQADLWKQKIGSEVQYLNAKNQKESLEGRMASLQAQLKKTQITAPVAGTVDAVNIKLGQSLSPGMPAFRVINYNDMSVVAELAESYIAKVSEGDAVELYFKDYNKEERSEIVFTGKSINQINRTFRVEAALDTKKSTYHPNMIVVLRINDYSVDSALTVPVNVLMRSELGQYVMVAEQQGPQWVARKRSITTGKSYGARTEVLSGLAAGDKLITVGYTDLNDGQEIRF